MTATVSNRSSEFGLQAAGRASWEIRPGVWFPNWSAVCAPQAEAALKARLALRGLEARWRGYDETEDRVRVAILRHYAAHGRAPDSDALADIADITTDRVPEILERLRTRDLVVLGAEQARVTGAYPFSDRDTGHRVLLDGSPVNAMCALDALGIGAMVGTDAVIEARCRVCETPIHIETKDSGLGLRAHMPDGAVVWSSLDYANGCGATSSCVSTLFFCSDNHLQNWLGVRHPKARGHRLSIEEAHEVGVAIFSPMLRAASR